MSKTYLWRAWSKDRERICDCGVVDSAESDLEASQVAWMLLDSPRAGEVAEMQLEIIPNQIAQILERSRDTAIKQRDDLAHDVLVLAHFGGMPDSYWETDSRVTRARETLGLTVEAARERAARIAETKDEDHVLF